MSFKIIAVELVKPPGGRYRSPDEIIKLKSEDGREIQLRLTGECCSGSYFEERSVEDVKALVGQTIHNIESVESSIADERVESTEENNYSGCSYSYHAVKITTDQGDTIVDWRNESNGYYDGTCTVTGFMPDKAVDEYDYNFKYADAEEL